LSTTLATRLEIRGKIEAKSGQPAGGFELKVFLAGRVAVETDGEVIDEARFPGRQGRLLFAYLVAERGRAVPHDELAEALWGEAPPPTWGKALSVLVSKLRGLLADQGVDGAHALTGAFGCYRLDLPEGTWVDVLAATDATHEAEQAIASGELAQAKAAASMAATLLDRPFLPGEEGAWVEEKRRELADLRERALAALAEACLRSGDASEAVQWAEQTVALAPFRETGYRRLMEAHVASGNRAEALRVYEQCRRLLADELGTYPSPETESVYRELLEAPASASPTVVPSLLPVVASVPKSSEPLPQLANDRQQSSGFAPLTSADETRRRRRWRVYATPALIGLVVAAVAVHVFGSGEGSSNSAVTGTVSFDGVWTGTERASFEKVITAFNRRYPEVRVEYRPVGENITTAVAIAVASGHPPDMADLPQPGFVKELARQGHLKPITYARSTITRNFAPVWEQLGTYDGKLYALVFKAANKSLLWYNVRAFRAARLAPPKTWAQLLADAKLLDAAGVPAYSIGGLDGWTLTDLFENVYLRMYGVAKYRALAAREIKWTDPTVVHALQITAQVIGDRASLAGGITTALQSGITDSVRRAFSTPPKAAIVFGGDFIARYIRSSTRARFGSDFNAVPFPTVPPGAGSNAVEIGADLLVTFRDTPAIEAFVRFLATAPAAEAWARLGGFGTANTNVPPSAYPDAITRAIELPLETATSVVFDMSDEQPAAFGSTVGQGEWDLFPQLLANPSQVKRIATELEVSATAAYKKSE
jgi:ABC-type glycerol-3-phosphate transport system substrate-binding protein/DNA-binding SARP family transcriptional activator